MIRKLYDKNWKTTLAGFILIGIAGYSIAKVGSITAESIALITMGAGLIAAKDNKDQSTKP